MMKKLFTFLLALAASVGMSWADTYVTITQNDFPQYGGNSFTKDGVTVSVGSIDSYEGRLLNGGSFSTTLGNFTKIEVNAGDVYISGEGWSGDFERQTWTGNASSVSFSGDISSRGMGVTIMFTIGDPAPTYTVALQDGTVNADKVTLSATSAVEGATITVTPDEEYEITAFKATYNTTEELSTSFNAETGAYSFTMPAYDVTIEATIALKPVPEGDIFAGFTATAGSDGFSNEGSANLVDNKFTSGNEQTDWTKWCANDGHKSVPTGESESCWWIDFEASAALNPTGYILTTGNDSGSEQGRNPKNWVLKAKLNADDAWTTIATVTNDVTMKNKSFKDYKFFVDKSGSYKYFRFEVFANQGANVMQLCELRLIGSEASEPVLVTAYTLQLHVNDAAMGSVAVTNLLGSDIVDNGDGTFTVPEGAEVTLLATPNEGYEFSGWKASQTICDFAECEFVDLNTVDNPLTFDMYAEAAFMAEFAAVAPAPAGNVVIWNMSMDAVNREVEQNETKEVFGGITIAVGAWRAFVMHERSNALLFSFSSKAQEGFTFANTLGVNFKKIVLSGAANTFDGKESTGWVINEDKSTITWEGDAASVSIWETLGYIGPVIVNEVEFTLEGGEPEPAGTVWTALKVGDVIKVGDKIEVPAEGDGSWGINGNVLRNAWGPYTLIRADIVQEDEFEDPEVTEAEDGAYYVFKAENSDFYPLSYLGKSGGLVVTMTSDGLVVTAAENKEFTVAVHENGGITTAVENVQTNHVQATKFFRDGQLYIMHNGTMYNVMGAKLR